MKPDPRLVHRYKFAMSSKEDYVEIRLRTKWFKHAPRFKVFAPKGSNILILSDESLEDRTTHVAVFSGVSRECAYFRVGDYLIETTVDEIEGVFGVGNIPLLLYFGFEVNKEFAN